MVARKVSPVLPDPKAIGDQKAQRVMQVLPVLLDPKEIGDWKVHRARRVILARQHRLPSEL